MAGVDSGSVTLKATTRRDTATHSPDLAQIQLNRVIMSFHGVSTRTTVKPRRRLVDSIDIIALVHIQFVQFIHNNTTNHQPYRRHDDQRLNDVLVGRVDIVDPKPRLKLLDQQFDLPGDSIELYNIGCATLGLREIR